MAAHKRFTYSPDICLGQHVALQWDDYRTAAGFAAAGWAATDRGWMFAKVSDPRTQDRVCLGYYLDYPNQRGERTDTVLAVSCVTRASARFADVFAAREFIESEARGREIDYAVERAPLYAPEKAALKVRCGLSAAGVSS